MGKKLVLVGDSAFAEIAHEYFTHDSEYEVVAFSVERPYLKRDQLRGLPVVPFEDLETSYPPGRHEIHVAVTYAQLNRLRKRLCLASKAKGYALASYVSSKAFVWRNAKVGEHCFIFEDNTVQPFVEIGDRAVLWSGNHVGHHSRIGTDCFVSSHVVISGFVTVGAGSFLGVNCTIANNVTIGPESWIGPGVLIKRDVPGGTLYKGTPEEPVKVTTHQFFKVDPS